MWSLKKKQVMIFLIVLVISGKLVNWDKSYFLNAPKTSAYKTNRIRNCTGIMEQVLFSFTYLGCLLYVGRKRLHLLIIWLVKWFRGFHSWHGKLLSYYGNIVLIKSALQSLRIYTSSLEKTYRKKSPRIFVDLKVLNPFH